MEYTTAIEGHEKLISTIYLLPEIPVIRLWREEQAIEIKHQQNFWKWVGARIDYLQTIQLGFRTPDPADQITVPILRTKLRVHSDYFFTLLQVLIDGFDIIKSAAEKKHKDFPFNNPRELLTEICRENAQARVEQIISTDIGTGSSISQIRKEQSMMGKFYRGSLSDQEMKKFCSFAEDCGLLTGFVMASINQEVEKQYLKKWESWQKFKKAHKNYCKYLNNKETRSIIWNAGNPVWSDNYQPVLYDDILNFS